MKLAFFPSAVSSFRRNAAQAQSFLLLSWLAMGRSQRGRKRREPFRRGDRPTGAALSDVAVTIKNVDTGATRTIATDGGGHYQASGLPPGRFEIQAANKGSQMKHARESAWRLARTPRSTLRCG